MPNRYLLLFVSLLFLGFCLWYFSAIVIYLLAAAVLSLVGQPIDRFYGKLKIGKYRLHSALSAGFALLTLCLVFFLLVSLFVPLLMEEARIIASMDRNAVLEVVQKPVTAIENLLRNFNGGLESGFIQSYLQEKLMSVFTIANVSLIFNKIIGALGDFFIAVFSVLFLTFFFLRDEKQIATALLLMVPEKYAAQLKNVLYDTERLLKRYFIGIVCQIALVILFVSLGLWIFGIRNALIIALFAGLLNVIPYLGPVIGLCFGLLIGLTTNPEAGMLLLSGKILLVFAIVQAADNFLFQPLIYSGFVKAHPVEIFLVILAGAALGGVGGMLLAVPAYTVLRVVAKEFFAHFRFVQQFTKGLEKK